MDLKIFPSKLSGSVRVPSSKSIAHRMIIAAALADGLSVLSNVDFSIDIVATTCCMNVLGAYTQIYDDIVEVNGIRRVTMKKVTLDCHESGSTLRFLIPLACALGVNAKFIGDGKLPQRPITPFINELPRHGVKFDFSEADCGCTLPLHVSGRLKPGIYEIDGSISSQFITGLMMSLIVENDDSEIVLTTKLNSKPYIDMTIDVLQQFGGRITETETGYKIYGNQNLQPQNIKVEGDYSQAAFFYVANALGADLKINGLNEKSLQGDRKIVEICEGFSKNHKPLELDCSDIPDLVPILTVLASFCDGKSRLTNVARLRHKECDRLAAMEDCLNRIGGKVTAYEDYIEIEGVKSFSGGEVECHNDHRIAMSMAIAATKCETPLIIHGAECVRKSFPRFFEVYKSIGGEVEEI